MPKDIIQLSINCSKCGANNKFDSDAIPTFCSFCGAALPDMRKHVDEAIGIALERQRHEMRMESEDKAIRKEKIRVSAQKAKSASEIMAMVVKLIVLLPCMGLIFFFVYMIIKQTSR